jgi:uncharacterized protein
MATPGTEADEAEDSKALMNRCPSQVRLITVNSPQCNFKLKTISVLYLHGFRSSPQSSKAVMIGEDLARGQIDYRCPALDISPVKAMAQINAEIDQCLQSGHGIRLIGSSLGGFYASAVMETHPARDAFKAALLNPAPWPARDLAPYVGELPAWHSQEVLHFRQEYIGDLKALEVGITDPSRYLLVAAKGDELLDWKEMVARYPGAHHHIIDGSDHGLSDFDQHWPAIKEFLLR